VREILFEIQVLNSQRIAQIQVRLSESWIEKNGVCTYDALHYAFAFSVGATFVTVDDALIKKNYESPRRSSIYSIQSRALVHGA